MAKIIFVVSETEKLAVRSMGLLLADIELEPCPLNVGDLISYPSAPLIALRVVQRWYRAGDESKEGVWYLTLEYARNPLDEPAP